MSKALKERLKPQSQERLLKFVRGLAALPKDPFRLYCTIRKGEIACSFPEAESAFEHVRQERFAEEVGDLGVEAQETEEREEVQDVGGRKEEERGTATVGKENSMNQRTLNAQTKVEFAKNRWLEDPTIPKNRMNEILKGEFKSGTDWNRLTLAKEEARAELKRVATPAPPKSKKTPRNGKPKAAKLRDKLVRYIIGDENPPPGITITVSVHVEAQELV